MSQQAETEQILSMPHYCLGAQAAQFGAPVNRCPFAGWYAESWIAGWADEREKILDTYATKLTGPALKQKPARRI